MKRIHVTHEYLDTRVEKSGPAGPSDASAAYPAQRAQNSEKGHQLSPA
jgi:hypothetical protein